MANTSEPTNGTPPSDRLANPFFTHAQIFAFGIPPSDDVIKEISKGGGKQDYLPIEYIRALLDRYVGPGKYGIEAVLHSTQEETVKRFEGRGQERKEVDRIAATACVNVAINIFAQDGSNAVLKHAAIGTNTQYASPAMGYGTIIGNAIYSAESAGIKKAAEKLGRAFGFDLTGKLNRDSLPPSLNEIRKHINDQYASRAATPAVLVVDNAPGEAEPRPAKPALGNENQQRLPAPSDVDSGETARLPEQSARDEEPEVQQPQQVIADSPESQSAPASGQANGEAETSSTAQPQAQANDPNWTLSIQPANYQQWIACAQTMVARIQAMTTEREVTNFVRRHSRLIENLPVLPAQDGKPERNFKQRWKIVVGTHLQQIGASVPPEYQIAA